MTYENGSPRESKPLKRPFLPLPRAQRGWNSNQSLPRTAVMVPRVQACFSAAVTKLGGVRPLTRTVKTIICLALLCMVNATSWADQPTRSTSFQSTKAFVTAVKAFKPTDSNSDLKKFFTIVEEKDVYPPATADAIDSCEIVWEGDTQAIVFTTAQPPTNNTLWRIGVLFYLIHEGDSWHISDIHRFDAQNQSAQVTCELTSGERTEPIVTVAITRGRREWTATESASYSPSDKKLVRRDPEQ